MTDILLKIKTKLELPDEYTEFSYNYNNYGEKATWNFNWSTADSSKNINLNCDDAAHIIYMNSYVNEDKRSMPDVTADEMLESVNKLLGRVFPEAEGHVILKEANCMYYRSAYQFNFTRLENGIEMPDNYVNLTVRYDNNELIGINSNWNYTSKVPSAEKLIGTDAAKEKIDSKLDMQLYYYVTRDENGKDRVFLAYVPSMTYIAADAKSGKLYTKKDYWDNASTKEASLADESDMANGAAEKGRGYEARLSDAESRRIAELKKLISSDDAVKIIKDNKYLLVDENADSVSASLSENDGKYSWEITLRDMRPEDYENGDYYRAYARATVDASDGRILSFNSSIRSLYYYSQQEIDSISFNYSKKECRNIFEKFVKSIENDKFGQVKLSSSTADEQIYNEETGKTISLAYAYGYTRYNEEIPFSSNGIYGSVDRITGKVYNYRVNWTDAEIPSAKGVIGEEKAYDAYMGFEGFDLVYEIVNKYSDSGSIYGYGSEQTIRLVYRTAINPTFVDAFTGKQIIYNGEEYEKVRSDYNYNDIEGSKYEKTIKILAGMGIGLPGESFEPDKEITKDELASLISKTSFFGYRDSASVVSGDGTISRQEAAKTMIGLMGLDYVAKLNIYKLSYKDAADVSKKYKGYVAIAGALGLLDDEDGKFMPGTALTRGEAAQLILKAASVAVSNQ